MFSLKLTDKFHFISFVTTNLFTNNLNLFFMKTNYFFLSVACATILFFSAGKVSAAAPYIYEGFDYELGTATNANLNGFNGGIGWGVDRTWGVWGGDITGTATNGVTDDSPLTVAGLVQTARHLNGLDNWVNSVSRMINGVWYSPYADNLVNGNLGMPGTTLWYSVILRPQNNKKTCSLSLSKSGDRNFAVRVGAFGGSFWGIEVGEGTENATAEALSTVPIVNNEVKFLVFKIDYAQTVGGTITLYVDPTPGTEPTVASATLTTENDIQFTNVTLFSGYSMGDMAADELRIATTYALVAPSTGGTTGIAKNIVENVHVYSNNGQIVADLSAVKGAATVTVFDTKGSVIRTIQSAGAELLNINVANQGVYLVRVQNGANSSTVKVVL